ncbi:MAG TPA: hypothetical protein DE179_07665 [Oceanospirillaceae bacterium]|nr:hypothetical protein [Oceanospirillaceae bacterium]
MKRIFKIKILAIAVLTLILSACSMPAKHAQHDDMAARIYTELATYYWQQGYTEIALDRLTLALQQTPDYPPAKGLLQKIQTQASAKTE